jgi:hypothetical protein
MKQRRMRSIPMAHGPVATPNIADQVTQAVAAGGRGRRVNWSATEVSSGLQAGAGILGIYLSFFVLRMQELYPVLAVPRLPMYLSIVILVMVLASTPMVGWKTTFTQVPAVRWQAFLAVLAVVTAPVGIWMAGSLWSVTYRYSLAVIVFIATTLFLRDRRAMAKALTILLVSATTIGVYALSDSAKTFGNSGRCSSRSFHWRCTWPSGGGGGISSGSFLQRS